MTAFPGPRAPAAPTLDEPLLALAVAAALDPPRRPGPALDALVAAFRAMPPRRIAPPRASLPGNAGPRSLDARPDAP